MSADQEFFGSVKTTDRIALNDWYPIDNEQAVTADQACPQQTLLLGQRLAYWRSTDDGSVIVAELGPDGTPSGPLPVQLRYGFVWTTLGAPTDDVFDIPEAAEPDRRYVACGWVTVRASAPRLVENFLDMAHFPFVHGGVLGVEDRAEVARYESEIRPEVDELWATNCRFFQPPLSPGGTGSVDNIVYRVPTPCQALLYRIPPSQPERLDVIALFIQPMTEDLCRAQGVEYLLDSTSTDAELIDFEQTIFLQDRIILEHQQPRRLPLDTRSEIPTQADTASLTYRRWLRAKGLQFGTVTV